MIDPHVQDNPAPDSRKDRSPFERYALQLHRYLARRLRRPQDVDDLAQEVYLRLLRLGNENRVRKPLPFLYGIAAHVLADFNMENVSEREHLTFDDEAVHAWSQSSAGMAPEELTERLNLQQQIERALAKLPRMHAAVLLAHKRDGLSYKEVAQRLNLSVHTVEKYLTQAKARIRMMSWDT